MENWKPTQSKLMQKHCIICLVFTALLCSLAESRATVVSSNGVGFDLQEVGKKEHGFAHVDGVGRKHSRPVGSSPPSCGGKCGGCTPCSPIRVTVPPKGGERLMMSAEYYPQRWNCSCGGKLYHP
ncbi:OLC1v1006419C1 [Oldenlandia corymbosa var. corymbosa]|uniref:Epidermal patterning factor-like protein n=1 Tax=Oldenlandia corymbosa var. corymbosa TaxID=529605 RepID=A0AAV1DJK7_OLDCO|nr:OLC1v1006419C1 [Oldenlandia corymbosa var. corymbosa]